MASQHRARKSTSSKFPDPAQKSQQEQDQEQDNDREVFGVSSYSTPVSSRSSSPHGSDRNPSPVPPKSKGKKKSASFTTHEGNPVPLSGMTEDQYMRKILDVLDKFRELGVGDELSLPQLVVVGDQSSGKSSLLEGLTGLAFPVATQLCTRFATQLILRRTVDGTSEIKVSIIPGPSSETDPEHKTLLDSFAATIEGDQITGKMLGEILDQAALCMGLPRPGTQDIDHLEKRFSDDVLRIERSGPRLPHLSVVDVPGLFHNETKHQTLEDAQIIRALIEKYVRDRRTIIMAVMDGRNNLANQEVFRIARAADPRGVRTVGVITKCDALQPGEEDAVLQIAKNSVERLTHGWFLVKNRSPLDIQNGVTIAQRNDNEKAFFRESPWNKLDRDRLGAGPLLSYLAKLLYTHIRGELPSLIKEMETLLEDCEAELEAMGAPRNTTKEQRQFLMRLANDYQANVDRALQGNYPLGLRRGHPLKLRMLLQNLNEAFSDRMRLNGHTRQFMTTEDAPDPQFVVNSESEVGDVDPGYDYETDDEDDIYSWIKALYRECRGPELPGTINPSTLEQMFREQSQEWETLARAHIDEVQEKVREFNDEVYSRVIRDDGVRGKVLSRINPINMASNKAAQAQLNTILDDERTGILQTVNHYFAIDLNKTRQQRMIARLEKLRPSGVPFNPSVEIDADFIQRIADLAHLSNLDQAVYDIHDLLKSYYKVAIKRFTDNVIVQVVERHCLGPTGSVRSFTAEYVGGLTDKELDAIAAEDFTKAARRTELTYQSKRYQKALRIVAEAGL